MFVFIILIIALALPAYAETAEEATANRDVIVTADGKRVEYWSSKHGIRFTVLEETYGIYAREFRNKPLDLWGLKRPFRGSHGRRTERIVDIRADRRKYITLRFLAQQLSDEEIKEWIEGTIRGFRAAQRYGMPDRENERKFTADGISGTLADYTWSGGSVSLVATFRNERGTYFFYARSRAYDGLESLVKTIKFVRKLNSSPDPKIGSIFFLKLYNPASLDTRHGTSKLSGGLL